MRTDFISSHHAGVTLAYFGLLILQLVWHALLPAPFGAESWWLALIATGSLLIPFKGIIKGNIRSMIWGGYLLVFFLVIGIVEAWSNPTQRLPALLQIMLVTLCIYSILRFSREKR
jgi:uncharacterized membrane protein